MINDLDNLVRGGRISVVKTKIAKLLNFKVLVTFNGKLELLDKASSISNAVEKSLKSNDKNIGFSKNGIKNIFITTNYLNSEDEAVLE